MRSRQWAISLAMVMTLHGCGGDDDSGNPSVAPSPFSTPSPTPTPTLVTAAVSQRLVAAFDNPWAMVFLPDGRLLVTEKPGRIFIVSASGAKSQVTGVPPVVSSGQLGLHDIVLDPNFATNNRVWLSYAEPSGGGQRVAVARATLAGGSTPVLEGLSVIWRATPSTTGGHPGARLAFSPDGQFLFVTAGERQQGSPAQDLSSTLGKIIRITVDGTPPADNPFAPVQGAQAEIWSLGHRNPYGLVFASDGRLFPSEMGPSGGDEFNLVVSGRNYGWPLASEGRNYDGSAIPAHSTNPAFTPPLVNWTATIAPGGMIQYRGTQFAGWRGDFILAGLVQQGLVRVRVSGDSASEVARIGLGARIREVEEAPDGKIWVLQDGSPANLIELSPG